MSTKSAIAKTLADDEKTSTPDAPILYDSNAVQIIPFTLTKNGKKYSVSYTVGPVSPERYFQLETDITQLADRTRKLSSDINNPKHKLYLDIVESRAGYKDSPDWKEATHQSDAVAVVQAILHAQVLDEADTDIENNDEFYDDEAFTGVSLNALFSGALLTLTHSYRPETKAEMDEFYAIETGDPNQNKLASAQKLSRPEKLYQLGRKLLREHNGYADGSDIPPWHIAATTEAYFLRQIARVGKSLNP